MACVIGSRRTWTKVVLRTIKNQKGKCLANSLRRSNSIHGMKKMVAKEEDEIGYEQENELASFTIPSPSMSRILFG
ncbi:hypothetical protein SLEP1_g58080 [Rubroshorea leprosula]|uniref:Uncharacterized protein n=1 Tax=Rubroshorea leprosula TaxID=152421 RepID=A0AAV5MNA9_9ROSI|nr:hypothetical protein SLEP1_g58080 [Rubroshorea leprosula]